MSTPSYYPALSENALTVLRERYLYKDPETRVAVETPDQMFSRVADNLAEADRGYGATAEDVRKTALDFFGVMRNLDFLPNSPTLANAGKNELFHSACVVLPIPDDLPGILQALTDAAMCHKAGAGTGFPLSNMRPAGDPVGGSQGVASGPLSFISIFDRATEVIKQGGMRRGANMAVLSVHHPAILEFVDHKRDLTKLTNFNVSVAATNAFMEAVEKGTTYEIVNPRTNAVMYNLDARTVFNKIINAAWASGEPGLLFMDRMNEDCPVSWLGLYEATNPCGEQPLLPYESCNLGSINLENFVDVQVGRPNIDWSRLREVIHVATHMLDNVIDVNHYPIPKIKEVTQACRKIGLGVMGFARMLYKLRIPYGSVVGVRTAALVMAFIDYEAKVASVKLAERRGCFPARVGHEKESNRFYDDQFGRRFAASSKYNVHTESWGDLMSRLQQCGIRNSNVTTIAPTGTLSIIADTSGGCEPVFALIFDRWQAGKRMRQGDKVFMAYLESIDYAAKYDLDELMDAIILNKGSLQGLQGRFPGLSAEAFDVFVVSHDIKPEHHVRTQAAFQAFNDSATSKTINFASSATVEDVRQAYELAWQLGCKGITVYRDGCRSDQPLQHIEKKDTETPTDRAKTVELALDAKPQRPDIAAMRTGNVILASASTQPDRGKRIRPARLPGFIDQIDTPEGKVYATFGYDPQGLREVFVTLGRSGGVMHAAIEALGRMISLALAYRVPREEVARSLIGIRSISSIGFGKAKVFSVADAIGKAIQAAPAAFPPDDPTRPADETPEPVGAFSEDEAGMGALAAAYRAPSREEETVLGLRPECPECGGKLHHAEGCETCEHYPHACTYSGCS